VSGVDLGCNKGKDGGSLIYEVRFSGGKKHRLPNSGTYSGTGWFEALERVDALLSDGDVHFRRWSWLNRDPLHPACLAHHRELYGTKRIDSLLRIGNL
jgi:hypothetical protein